MFLGLLAAVTDIIPIIGPTIAVAFGAIAAIPNGIIVIILSIFVLSSSVYACDFFKKRTSEGVKTANLFNSQLTDDNTVWVGTFQLLWNNLSDNYVKGPIVFSNGQIPFAEELNKQEFNKFLMKIQNIRMNHISD